MHLAWGALSPERAGRARTASPRRRDVGRGPWFVTLSTGSGIAFVIIFNPRGLRLGQFFTKDESHETALGHGVTGHVPRWPLPCLGDLFPYQFRPARRPPAAVIRNELACKIGRGKGHPVYADQVRIRRWISFRKNSH